SFVHAIPLRDDLGSMEMEIGTKSVLAQSYFNQGLRWTSTFKFDFAAESQQAALEADPSCAMCFWGLALAYGQNLNDAVVMTLEPEFLANEPLAYDAITKAAKLINATDYPASLSKERDTALINAMTLRMSRTLEKYKSLFVDGLPKSLNQAYAEAMTTVAERAVAESWPATDIVRTLAADSLMGLSPWDYWVDPDTQRPNAMAARVLLEAAMTENPENPWAIHLYTHLMEAGSEAGLAVPHAKRLKDLVPGAAHLQHMPSHVEFRTGLWHDASAANMRAIALPDKDASYPDHNMDMLM
ncbi:unnamed protein product, partial [Choristocarpus tenellus]